MYKALRITVHGRVQGVGFRPFIYSLAIRDQIKGTVQNHAGSVSIHVEGRGADLSRMVKDIQEEAPPLARISDLKLQTVALHHYETFSILPSEKGADAMPWISADTAVCDKCLEEWKNPENRRFHHPFINCTQCGPRYTIIQGFPYDRIATTMKEFSMCPECQKEYDDPGDRRHHAQPNCCPSCGPTLTLYDKEGKKVAADQEAVAETVASLSQGKIVAIKGIGGYHLACDAYQEGAVQELRRKKRRSQKPFAIMVDSLATARKLCHLSTDEEKMLTEPEKPIVVLEERRGGVLALSVAPGLSSIGVMLPYTPLHHSLFEDGKVESLVMTSSNPSGLPIPYEEKGAEKYSHSFDLLLTHNRAIHTPLDDSVVQLESGEARFVRRARGFVPDPIPTESHVDQIIALGGQQKNTFAIGRRKHILVGPHIGDLDNEEMMASFKKQLTHFKEWLDVDTEMIAIDKHPLYATSLVADEMKRPVVPVQHHHAHHVSCMEDNGLSTPALGLILDGTGYGEDGNIWGFEFLYGDAHSFERAAHLAYTPLPGGEKAVKEPWRIATGMMLHYWPQDGKKMATKLFPDKRREIDVIQRMIERGVNVPMAGSCGRLFDAVGAMLGICHTSTYEGEAAMKVSDYMIGSPEEADFASPYPYHLNLRAHGVSELDFSPMLQRIVEDKLSSIPKGTIIERFHSTLVASCVEMVVRLFDDNPEWNRTVVLSGGSFQNSFLLRETKRRLQKQKVKVYTHQKVPCNDGGLSLGQLIIAAHTRKRG